MRRPSLFPLQTPDSRHPLLHHRLPTHTSTPTTPGRRSLGTPSSPKWCAARILRLRAPSTCTGTRRVVQPRQLAHKFAPSPHAASRSACASRSDRVCTQWTSSPSVLTYWRPEAPPSDARVWVGDERERDSTLVAPPAIMNAVHDDYWRLGYEPWEGGGRRLGGPHCEK